MSNYCERCGIIVGGETHCNRCVNVMFLLGEYKILKEHEKDMVSLTREDHAVMLWLTQKIADLECQ